MKQLPILIVSVLLLTVTTQAQNTIQNFTDNENVGKMVEKGLEDLRITDATITLLPMKDYYKSAKKASNGKPWGATISANKRVFTVIISTRHEVEVGLSFEERIAHELIHVKQGYEGKEGDEKEAYKKQYKLSQLISQ